MPPYDLEKLSRTLSYDGQQVVILRPGIALVFYSRADFATLMDATAEVLQVYLDFVPPGAIVSTYEPPPDDDEYTPGRWVAFDSTERRKLVSELRARPSAQDNESYSFVLSATPDGQAGNYGVSFVGMNFAVKENYDDMTSILRLEFPWNLLDTVPVASLIDLFERTAMLFPFCSGHAGMSFIHPISFVQEARDEIHKLLPRFLGFDSAHNSARLKMRGKTPPAHWLNLLNSPLVKALGGEEKLRSALERCEVTRLGSGLLIRAARFPPVVDVNRGGLDIGRLPTVARVLKPIRLDEGLFAGLQDAGSGQAWLERFDNLASRDWDNS
jgi:hypothetical protein